MADIPLAETAAQILKQLRRGEAPGRVSNEVRQRTGKSLPEVAGTLLDAGQIDLAESLYLAALEHSVAHPWPALGLTMVAEKRGDTRGLASALRECLRSFPDHANPNWFARLVRAERELGNNAAAEKTLRDAAERFPHSGVLAATFAELLSAAGRNEDAIAAWRVALGDFPDEARLSWFVALASLLRLAGRKDEEDEVAARMAELFPDDGASLEYRANQARSRQDWANAFQLFTRCIERNPQAPKPEWFAMCARSLFRMGREEEALETWCSARRRFPDRTSAIQEEAAARQELGHWAEAELLWTALIERNGDSSHARWHTQRLHCRLNQPFRHRAHDAIVEFEARFPDLPDGRLAALDDASARHLGLEAISALVSEGLGRFPGDRRLIALHQLPMLLGSGHVQEAEQIVQDLEAADNDVLSFTARWNLALDRGAAAAARDSIQETITGQVWELAPALSVYNHLIGLRSVWGLRQARRLLEDLARQFPTTLAVRRCFARVLIELGEDDQALATVDLLPDICRTGQTLELKAWAAYRRGDLRAARSIWDDILSRHYFAAVHGPEPGLVRMNGPGRDTGRGVIAFACVRDEIANLPGFLRHHRKLGIRQFVIVDNLSTDGTDAYLHAQPDVILYRTPDNFPAAAWGMRWINRLIELHGVGRWCLFADADEEFIYPGWESLPLDAFSASLDAQGAEAVFGFMLDVFPDRLVDPDGNPATRDDCRYFDLSYDWLGNVRPPYRRPAGGIRYRLFETQDPLQKVPLVKGGCGSYLNNHETTPMRLADVGTALLHYKCTDLFAKAGQYCRPGVDVRALPDRTPGSMRRYERYASRLESIAHLDLRSGSDTRPLGSSLTLAEYGLMQAPPVWREASAPSLARDSSGQPCPHMPE